MSSGINVLELSKQRLQTAGLSLSNKCNCSSSKRQDKVYRGFTIVCVPQDLLRSAVSVEEKKLRAEEKLEKKLRLTPMDHHQREVRPITAHLAAWELHPHPRGDRGCGWRR